MRSRRLPGRARRRRPAHPPRPLPVRRPCPGVPRGRPHRLDDRPRRGPRYGRAGRARAARRQGPARRRYDDAARSRGRACPARAVRAEAGALPEPGVAERAAAAAALAGAGPHTRPDLFPSGDHALAYLADAHIAWMIALGEDPGTAGLDVRELRDVKVPLDGGTTTLRGLEAELARRAPYEPRLALFLNPGWRSGPPLPPRSPAPARTPAPTSSRPATMPWRTSRTPTSPG